jgi:DNA-binding CsgD family transcriptional regulator
MLPSAQAMLVRWTIADATGEDSGPAVAPLWIELKRFYLALRSSLQRVYGTTADWEAVRPVLAPLGFRPVTTPVRVGDELRVLMVIDFPPGGIDAWLASIVDLETAVSDSTEVDPAHTSDTATLDVAARFGLSPRELEVLGLVADGLTNHEIAARLYISERTVNRHVTTVFTKLGVNNRVAAARIAVQPDWTPPPNRQLS